MDDTLVAKIAAHPKYQELKARRTRFGLWLTVAMLELVTPSPAR